MAIVSFAFLFLWYALHQIYLKSFGVSLKSVSLTDVEIAPDNTEEGSILNRHLDEIIYFFQSTKYELVIIEDLDRFENSEIFVILREINALVNKNYGVKRTVRFLYALRDDVFQNTDRTKFFEFIVPIVPIINHSNSIDKVLEEGQRLSLEDKLDKQFLREVSRYLSDLRLIKNIFNEFVTYEENLDSEGNDNLDRNKLLAVLIYKNVKPKDFEKLHQQKGVLAGIFNEYENLIASKEGALRTQIVAIESSVAQAKKQLPASLKELRNIYAMAVIQHVPAHYSAIRFENFEIQLSQLPDHERFEDIIHAPNLIFQNIQRNQRTVNLPNIENEVNPQRSYLERKADIELLSTKQLQASTAELRELRSKLEAVRTEMFSAVIRSNTSHLESHFSELGESEDLIRFLIFEGYLDDSYYQYISLFHSGRLSPSDNNFLIKIRGFNNPDPNYRLDNTAEVIAMMRDEDFGQPYVLNRYLMDELLNTPSEYYFQLKKAVGHFSRNFAQCSDFFSRYYTHGKRVGVLMNVIVEHWSGFVVDAIESDSAADHVANLLSHVPSSKLTANTDSKSSISSYLDANLAAVLDVGKEFEFDSLVPFDVRVEQLSTLSANTRALSFLVDNSLYQITVNNLRIALAQILRVDEVAGLSEQNFTTIISAGKTEVREHVENNFESYLRDVLLTLEENTKEKVETILIVLQRSEVPEELLYEFLAKQEAVFPSLDPVPQQFHTYLFQNSMIEAKWENLSSYVQDEGFEANTLTQFMQSKEVKDQLLQCSYNHSDDTLPLSRFIFTNMEFSENEYRNYVSKLPIRFKDFPKDAPTAIRLILIEENIINLTEEVFQKVQGDTDVLLHLLSHNIEEYFENKSSYPIDDNMRASLLKSGISLTQKLQVIDDMDLIAAQGNAMLVSSVGEVFEQVDVDFKKYPTAFLLAIIKSSPKIGSRISVLNKFQNALTVEEVRQVVRGLPNPFPELLDYGWSSRSIPNTPENQVLVEWLERRKLISSSSPSIFGAEIKVNRFRKQR